MVDTYNKSHITYIIVNPTNLVLLCTTSMIHLDSNRLKK